MDVKTILTSKMFVQGLASVAFFDRRLKSLLTIILSRNRRNDYRCAETLCRNGNFISQVEEIMCFNNCLTCSVIILCAGNQPKLWLTSPMVVPELERLPEDAVRQRRTCFNLYL